MMVADKNNQVKAEEILFPGKEIPNGLGLTITVFPVGFNQIKKFSKNILGALELIASSVKADGSELLAGDKKKLGMKVLAAAVPAVIEDLLDLVEECVTLTKGETRVPIGKLPHWEVPPIIEAFLMENFGEESRIRPWIEAVKNIMSRMQSGSDSMLGTGSNSSSPADTQ